jgi:hypothetical protein
MSLAARFWARVDRSVPGGCWMWTGGLNRGYGRLKVAGRLMYAHRLAWELERGPVPDGLTLDHLCRVLACVNPDHLEPVTVAENIRRKPRADFSEREQCRNGHPWTDVRLSSQGVLVCRACAREATRRHRLRRMARSTGVAS